MTTAARPTPAPGAPAAPESHALLMAAIFTALVLLTTFLAARPAR